MINKKSNGAVIVPDRAAHSLDTIELIASVKLRDILKLENGKEVIVN